jgi:hypothetical protein
VIGSAALAAVTLLAVQGCAPAAAPDAATGVAYHGLTIADAQAAYASYVTVSDSAAAQGNETLGLSNVGDAQWAIVKGQYTALASSGTAVPRYRYGQPVFYVPALTGYPQWFMVAVPRKIDTDGHLGAAVNTMMVFERWESTTPWGLDGSAVLGQPLPAIARDRDGYAINVATNDASLLLRPDVLGATQAAVADEGPGSPAAAVIASGPWTTGMYATQAALASAEAAKGLTYSWLLEGAPFADFELRTTDGGALVLYGMYLDTTNEHPNLVAGSAIPVPPEFVPLLAAPNEVGNHAVYANWTYEFAAVDPPQTAHGAKVDVIGANAGPTYGHAY